MLRGVILVKRVLYLVLCFVLSCSLFVYADDKVENEELERIGYTLDNFSLEEFAGRRLYVYGLIDNQMDESIGIPMVFLDEDGSLDRLFVSEMFYKLYDLAGEGCLEERADCKFLDVPESHIKYVNLLSEKGIVDGVSDSMFNINECTIDSFSCIVLRYLGIKDVAYNDSMAKLEELGLLEYTTLENGFTKGDAYIVFCNLLDYEVDGVKIIDKLVLREKRDEILLPRGLSISVNSYSDFRKKLDFAYSFAPAKININLLDSCSLEDSNLIYDFVLRAKYSWQGLFDDFYDISSVYSYNTTGWCVKYSEKIKEHWRVSENEFAKEAVKKWDEIEELYKNGEYSSYGEQAGVYKDYLQDIACFELLADRKKITLSLINFNNSVYLNLELLDWIQCYNKPEFQKSIMKCLSEIDEYKGCSDYQKVLKVHNYICQNAVYDYNEYRNIFSNNKNNKYIDAHSVDGFLTDGRIVCDGYAYTFQWLLDYLGVESIIVYGDSTSNGFKEGHAWNKVKLDGEWYNVDVCWADTGCGMNYFLKSDKFFQRHYHIPDEEFLYPNIAALNNYL